MKKNGAKAYSYKVPILKALATNPLYMRRMDFAQDTVFA